MNSKPNRMAIAMLSLGAMVLAGSGIALAAPQPKDNQVVQYNDLNLGTRAGVHELANRIQDAAWQVCLTVAPPSSTAPGNLANSQCQAEVVKEAVNQVNNPDLAEMFPAAPAAGDDLTSD
jgi:UrcA family protein